MNAPFPLSSESLSLADLRDPGEVARIEGFVAQMRGSPFHRPAWLHAIARGTGQKATGIVAERRGQLTGWLPLTEAHSPLFGRALVSSGFAVDGGPLSDTPDTAISLCRMAQELALRSSCASIELRGGHAPGDWNSRDDTHCGFVTDLAEDDAQQLLAVPRKQRAEIRKGLKNDLKVTVGTLERDRAAHYAVYAESVRNLGTPVFPRSLFSAVLCVFGKQADILSIWDGDTPVASVLSLYDQNTVYPYWGGGTFAARHLRANERMYYELMCHARGRGMDRFDFGRSKTGSGPYSFKKNWGFEPEALIYSSWTAPGQHARDVSPDSEAYSAKIALWKKLPLSVANRIGPMIAKGLA
ncbi:FemAB family XrtA/PEP-CTERM system-associated protein [Pontixanthobacter sp.]|uniref:FemAB family XrtA/PEP-CTERM system-associated protein n=1 Tax=Pontixanthobacter sp. TaxID=2792078 RepID=UPI003C7BC1DF